MKPNTNPLCPYCKGRTQKIGVLVFPYAGRQQRYRCTECGKSFGVPIKQ